MLKWLPFPLLRISLLFVCGVFTGFQIEVNREKLEILWVISLVVFFIFRKTNSQAFKLMNIQVALVGMLLVFLAGVLRAKWNPYQPDTQIANADYYQARVVESPGPYDQRYLLQLEWVWQSGTRHTVDDRILWIPSVDFKLYQDSLEQPQKTLSMGDRVIVTGSPNKIWPPSNPREFNYAQYMARSNTFWQHWISIEDILAIHPNSGHRILPFIDNIKYRLQQSLMIYLPAGAAREITMAMLLGERKAVSDDLSASFARSGTIHILAVSGLHLGILYWLLLQLFGNLQKHRVFKWMFVLICLAVLWTFTIITGMAPSTKRAATMFSVLLVGKILSWHTHNLNNLGAAAVFLLYLDPYQLYSVGFQLSFLALAGILYFYPLIRSWYRTENRLPGYFVDLMAVSLAAQVAVMPLSIYYFHQLPLYFLLSNALMVPLAFAIVLVGVAFLVCSTIPLLATPIAALLEFLTSTAASVVRLVAAIPGGTLSQLEIGVAAMLAGYLLIWLLARFLSSRNPRYLRIFLWMAACCTLFSALERITDKNRELLVVYQIPSHTAIDFISQGRFACISDAELPQDSSTLSYKAGNFRRSMGLERIDPGTYLNRHQPIMQSWIFNGKKLLLIKSVPAWEATGIYKFKYDIVIITNSSIRSLTGLNSWLSADLWIMDGSNKPWVANQVEQEARRLGLNFHNCWKNGAKIITL